MFLLFLASTIATTKCVRTEPIEIGASIQNVFVVVVVVVVVMMVIVVPFVTWRRRWTPTPNCDLKKR